MQRKTAFTGLHSTFVGTGQTARLYERPFVIDVDRPIATAKDFSVEQHHLDDRLSSIVRADRVLVQEQIAILGRVALQLSLTHPRWERSALPTGTLVLSDQLGLVFSLRVVDLVTVGKVQFVSLRGKLEPLSQEKPFELVLELDSEMRHTWELRRQ